MSNDFDNSALRIPSLVQFCQRVASNNVDRICSLGDSLRYELLEPILENCNEDTLLRFEDSSPYIQRDTADIWKRLCFRTYPLPAQQYTSDLLEEPESWRDVFFELRDLEERRLDSASERLRSMRQEAEERKKVSQIKITDKLPPAKRARGWGFSQPKTLLQKTRSTAVRLHKGLYGPGGIPMPPKKTFQATPASSAARLLPSTAASSAGTGSRVTVTAVPVRRPTAAVPKAQVAAPMAKAASSTLASGSRSDAVPSSSLRDLPLAPMADRPASPDRPQTRPVTKPPVKKDPMASMFIPKHRAFNQLTHGSGKPSRT